MRSKVPSSGCLGGTARSKQVPPELLPLSVVEELEGRMLKVVEAMLQHGKRLNGSRCSSTAGDQGTEDDGVTFLSRVIKESWRRSFDFRLNLSLCSYSR
jgi:hypothetical protein